jgi:hypothetical protein
MATARLLNSDARKDIYKCSRPEERNLLYNSYSIVGYRTNNSDHGGVISPTRLFSTSSEIQL